jgi:hypothetical protein
MVKGDRIIVRASDVRVIVALEGEPPIAKSIVSPAVADEIALLKLPAPESLVFRTVRVAAERNCVKNQKPKTSNHAFFLMTKSCK